MSSERRLLACVLALGISASACADWERGKSAPDSGAATTADAAAAETTSGDLAVRLSYAASVHRAITDGCARCHSANGSARSSAFVLNGDVAADRAQVLKFVNADNPAASRLLSKTAGMGHGGGTIYASGTPEYRTILDWITQGGSP